LFWIQGPKLTTQVEGNKISVEKPAALSVRLKTIKTECEEVDDRVHKVSESIGHIGCYKKY
jgi:hypothetical protein